ncbi:MAG: hypothetical protein N2321_02895 [Melioribacteraceae bacterium]|nr:hypothetical protein [Melioribacteraceae bacterium]
MISEPSKQSIVNNKREQQSFEKYNREKMPLPIDLCEKSGIAFSPQKPMDNILLKLLQRL